MRGGGKANTLFQATIPAKTSPKNIEVIGLRNNLGSLPKCSLTLCLSKWNRVHGGKGCHPVGLVQSTKAPQARTYEKTTNKNADPTPRMKMRKQCRKIRTSLGGFCNVLGFLRISGFEGLLYSE